MFRYYTASRLRRSDIRAYHGDRLQLRPISVMRRHIVAVFFLLSPFQFTMAEHDTRIIDDRKSGSYLATTGGEWRLITDGVMGGISEGRLTAAVVENQDCLRLQGDVKLDNNGGFVQAALDLSTNTTEDIDGYTGLMLSVYGNGEQYNIHLRTRDNRLPWQSYRVSFTAQPEWKHLYVPFTEFDPYRTSKAFDLSRLQRIGIVAIGREFSADLCIGMLGLYR